MVVTGNRGFVGSAVAAGLAGAGHEVTGYDLVDGQDLLELDRLNACCRGHDAVVHLAALAHDTAGTPEQILTTNVIGTWHVLRAAEEHGLDRVVFVSSAQALGVAEGESPPDYLPIDDRHPTRASRPYGLSKRAGEELCRAFTERTGTPTICLRPFAVWGPEQYHGIWEARRQRPEFEWEPFWEFGAFIDIRDFVEAVRLALMCPDPGHVRLLLCSADISASAPSREMARRLMEDIEWRGGSAYESEPYKALVDTHLARETLGWEPVHSWANWVGKTR